MRMRINHVGSLCLTIFILASVCCGQNVSPKSDAKIIEDYVTNLENGRLIYNPPIEMIINKTEQINATITEEGNLGEMIKVAPIMEVYLKGSTFRIDPITESRQFIAITGPTIWKWDVIPNKIGNQTLDLLAYIIVKMPEGHEERRALVKNKTIEVNVNPLEIPSPISIKSIPAGAEVTVDGFSKGTTPIIISDLTIGSHDLKLKHSGYLDYETNILSKSAANNLTYDLKPEPSPLSNPYVIAAIFTAIAVIVAGYFNYISSKKK